MKERLLAELEGRLKEAEDNLALSPSYGSDSALWHSVQALIEAMRLLRMLEEAK